MTLHGRIASIHEAQEKLFRLCNPGKTEEKVLTQKVDALISKYGEFSPSGSHDVLLVIPNVCKETLFKKTGIVPRANEQEKFPWAFMADRKTDPYLVVNPHLKEYKKVKLAGFFSEFYRNPRSFLRTEELIAGIFSHKISLSGPEVFVPLTGDKNGMLIWSDKEKGEYHSMVSGFAKGITFQKVAIPRCETIIC